jgi:hypothetical protein
MSNSSKSTRTIPRKKVVPHLFSTPVIFLDGTNQLIYHDVNEDDKSDDNLQKPSDIVQTA